MPAPTGPTKDDLRARLIARRAGRAKQQRHGDAAALTEAVLTAWPRARSVACYLPLATEPPTDLLVDRLADAGTDVWLPVVSGPDLLWVRHDPAVAPSRSDGLGLWEPAGRRTGPALLERLDVVLVPALAVDRHGTRLGRGRGYYDRALARLGSVDGGPPVAAVVYDEELVDLLPSEPHDVPVDAAVTPGLGVVALGHAAPSRGVEG